MGFWKSVSSYLLPPRLAAEPLPITDLPITDHHLLSFHGKSHSPSPSPLPFHGKSYSPSPSPPPLTLTPSHTPVFSWHELYSSSPLAHTCFFLCCRAGTVNFEVMAMLDSAHCAK